MKPLHPAEMLGQPLDQRRRKHCHAVTASLAPTNADLASLQVDVLHPEREALEQSHASAIQQQSDQLIDPLELTEDLAHSARVRAAGSQVSERPRGIRPSRRSERPST